jgi:RNA polymerase sigma-54 factor
MRMEIASVLEMPEAELGERARAIEADPIFKRLAAAGVVTASEMPAARFAARRFAGRSLRLSGDGLPSLVDGNCDLARLMQRVGQEPFKQWFLGEGAFSDEERGRGCGITPDEARMLREFVDRAFIQGEFEATAPSPEKLYSAVAGIRVEDGKPLLAFFHREVWKQRYRVNKGRLAEYLGAVPKAEAREARNLLGRLELLEQRKTNLYRILEEVMAAQAEYLRTGDPAWRRPLTQRAMAARLSTAPSVINRLISNKSVEMPWGMETPLSVFFPSAKEINRGRLYELVTANPGWKDEELRSAMARRHGVRLSRQSIVQYRKELGLGGRSRRSRRN